MYKRQVRKFNANQGKANLAASPAQRMHALICGPERDQYLFPFLPPLREGEADLSKSIVKVPIRGNKATAVSYTHLDVYKRQG